MKFSLVAVALFTSMASAVPFTPALDAKVNQSGLRPDGCVRAIKRKCIPNQSENDRMANARYCFQSGKKFTFISNNRRKIYSVETDGCTTSAFTIPAAFEDQNYVQDIESFHGRQYMVLKSHNVVVVGRDNSILELFTSAGTPYQRVKAVGEDKDQDKLILQQEGLPTLRLSPETLDARIRNQSETLVVSESTDPMQQLLDILNDGAFGAQ